MQKFGTEAFYRPLKAAYDRGDQDTVAAMLYDEVRAVAAQKLRMSIFSAFTRDDREDALQDAMLYTLSRIGEFLGDPLNDPASPEGYPRGSQLGWLHRIVLNGLKHTLSQVARHRRAAVKAAPGADASEGSPRYEQIVSLDTALSPDGEATMMDALPDRGATPEERRVLMDRLDEACAAFFSLTNAPELVAAVGYMLLSQSLGNDRRSLDDFARGLNGRPAAGVIDEMAAMLARWGIDPAALDPLRRRAGDGVIGGLTAKSLANRKNSMLTTLRRKMTEDDRGD